MNMLILFQQKGPTTTTQYLSLTLTINKIYELYQDVVTKMCKLFQKFCTEKYLTKISA